MLKWLKVLGLFLAALLLVVVIGIGLLVIFVNPNDLKEPISKQVHQATGRTLTMGDINWSFFPWLKLELHNVSLSNALDFGDKPFLQVGQADFQIRLLPLLSGRIEINSVSLHHVDLNLIKNKEGKGNWQGIGIPQNPPANDRKKDNASEATKSNGSFFSKPDISVTTINVADSHVVWLDQKKNQQFDLNHIAFEAKDIAPNQAIPIRFEFDLDKNNIPFASHMVIATKLRIDFSQQRFLLDALKIQGNLPGQQYADGKLSIDFNANITVDNTDGSVVIQNIDSSIANMKAAGDLRVTQLKSSPQLMGELKIPTFDLREFLAAVGKPVPETNDPSALRAVSVTTQLTGDVNTINLKKMTMRLDDSAVTGDASFNGKVTFDLSVDKMDVDRYLPSKTSEKVAASQNNFSFVPSAYAATPTNAGEGGDDLSVTGQLKVGAMKLAKLAFDNLRMQINENGNTMKFSSIKADFYRGTYFGDITVDRSYQPYRITTEQTWDNVQIEPVLQTLSPDSRIHVSGTANVNAKLNLQGGIDTLNGTTLFVVKNGVLKGINIPYYLDMAKAAIQKQTPPQPTGPNQTDFGNLSGLFTVNHGVMSNNDLLLKGPLLQVTGNGTANLVTKQLNYHLNATQVKTTTDEAGVQSASLKGMTLPIKITGTFDNPVIRPDVESLVRAEVQKQVEKRKEEVKEKIQQKIDEKLEKHPLLKRRLQQQLNLDSLMR